MSIVASDVENLTGNKENGGDKNSDDFYGRFNDLDLDSVKEVRETREKS